MYVYIYINLYENRLLTIAPKFKIVYFPRCDKTIKYYDVAFYDNIYIYIYIQYTEVAHLIKYSEVN